MSEQTSEPTPITENDIVFECPFCGKSMAIDKRGMGLTIECPDCKGLVRVPMVSENTASSPDSVHMPVEGLANALEESRGQVEELIQHVQDLEAQRESLQKALAEKDRCLAELKKEFGLLQTALDRVSLLLADSGAVNA